MVCRFDRDDALQQRVNAGVTEIHLVVDLEPPGRDDDIDAADGDHGRGTHIDLRASCHRTLKLKLPVGDGLYRAAQFQGCAVARVGMATELQIDDGAQAVVVTGSSRDRIMDSGEGGVL